jgi:hypothetical protein
MQVCARCVPDVVSTEEQGGWPCIYFYKQSCLWQDVNVFMEVDLW